MTIYRIVTDKFCGYEVQAKRWWFPFWMQCDFKNTHVSIKDAEQWANEFAKDSNEVKRLGRLPPNDGINPKGAYLWSSRCQK